MSYEFECYRTAQVCCNGHLITANCEENLKRMELYCSQCGEKTITACPSCKIKIHGQYESSKITYIRPAHLRGFCHDCGMAYPWTQKKIAKLEELADELEGFGADDRKKFKGTFTDLITDNAGIEVAAVRFKKLLAKGLGTGGKAVGEILYKMMLDVASEAGKKCLVAL